MPTPAPQALVKSSPALVKSSPALQALVKSSPAPHALVKSSPAIVSSSSSLGDVIVVNPKASPTSSPSTSNRSFFTTTTMVVVLSVVGMLVIAVLLVIVCSRDRAPSSAVATSVLPNPGIAPTLSSISNPKQAPAIPTYFHLPYSVADQPLAPSSVENAISGKGRRRQPDRDKYNQGAYTQQESDTDWSTWT
ncbi:Uncharacterized protein PBTT_09288 [Plasmodiophora brassicae]